MRCLTSRYGAPLLLLVVAAFLAGCQEPPPGDLNAVSEEDGYVGPPDTVKARLLGWKTPMGSTKFAPLDSTETAWLEARDYVLVDWRVDSTATYYYRRRADRHPRWDRNTVMTERFYARRSAAPERSTGAAYGSSSPETSAGVSTDSTPAPSTVAGDSPRRGNGPAGPGGPPAPMRTGGPWSIVVGAMTDSTAARSLVATYRARFSTSLPVFVEPVAAGDSTLYRVLVGAFDSLAVRRALDRYDTTLPGDAWPVRRP